jgi:hypothetical protein
MKLSAAIIIVLTAAAGCSQDDISPKATGTSPSEAWTEYSDTQGRFHVLLPGDPEHATHEMPTPFGGTMTFHNIMVHTSNNTKLFYVTYVDYPMEMKPEDEAGVDEIISRYVTGGAKKKNLQLEHKSRITIGDYLGEEYLFTDPAYGDKSLWNVYFVDNRLYQLVSNWAPNLHQSSDDAEKFLKSFRLEN